MKKTGLIYSFNTKKTKKIAEMLQKQFDKNQVEAVNVETIDEETFLKFDRMILGVATWHDGELPNYWDEFVPAIEFMDLKDKEFAIFGLGDQKGYPENFADGIGLLADVLRKQGGKIVGFTATEGYSYECSVGVENDQFMGLVLDFENQKDLNKERVETWAKQLKEQWK